MIRMRRLMRALGMAVLGLVFVASTVTGQDNRAYVTVTRDGETISLPVFSALEGIPSDISGGALLVRKAGESEEDYKARFQQEVLKAQNDEVSLMSSDLWYYWWVNWRRDSICFRAHAEAYSEAKMDGTRYPIDYIYVKARLYKSGTILVAEDWDDHTNSAYVAAHTGTHDVNACVGEAIGNHEWRHTGYDNFTEESYDTNWL